MSHLSERVRLRRRCEDPPVQPHVPHGLSGPLVPEAERELSRVQDGDHEGRHASSRPLGDRQRADGGDQLRCVSFVTCREAEELAQVLVVVLDLHDPPLSNDSLCTILCFL